VSLLSCKSGSDDPVGTVRSFLKAIDSSDFSKAEKLVTKHCLPTVLEIKKNSKNIPVSENPDYQYQLISKEDTTANVFVGYQFTNRPSPDLAINIYLVKQKGAWLIDSIKDSQ
jgi:hypothetical protein